MLIAVFVPFGDSLEGMKSLLITVGLLFVLSFTVKEEIPFVVLVERLEILEVLSFPEWLLVPLLRSVRWNRLFLQVLCLRDSGGGRGGGLFILFDISDVNSVGIKTAGADADNSHGDGSVGADPDGSFIRRSTSSSALADNEMVPFPLLFELFGPSFGL